MTGPGHDFATQLPLVSRFAEVGDAFGDPDGKRADLKSLVDVELGAGTGSSSRADAQRARVLVGRKGAGKTLYMRRMKDVAQNENSVEVFVDEAEQTNLLSTRHVVQVAHWFPPAVLTEVWTQLWNRALLYSLASQVLRSPDLAPYVAEDDRAGLEQTHRKLLLGLGQQPRSAFTTARELIITHRLGHELTRTLDDPAWDDLETALGNLLATAPPVYFYLDAIDEDFAHAPMYWLRCQKGLFYYVMRLLRNSVLGGRLHVVICVRDVVLSSVYRSEHAPRYRNDPHIRSLSWTPDSTAYLLRRKVGSLADRYLRPGAPRPTDLAQWIGLATVRNRYGVEEPVDRYALRHSQMVPRDVVLLGNHIGEQLRAKRVRGEGLTLTEDEFRTTVSDLARFGGLNQIELCANQLVSEAIPVEASRHDFLDFYTATMEYRTGVADQLLALLTQLSGQRVPAGEVEALIAAGRRAFEDNSDLGSVLWQNGLLGYSSGGRDVFYSLDSASRFRLPSGEDEYVLHPSLYECAGLAGSGRPVSAFP